MTTTVDPPETTTHTRVLMKDGVWLVPPEQRPRGWERYNLAEPTPVLDAVIEQAEATSKKSLEVRTEATREESSPVQPAGQAPSDQSVYSGTSKQTKANTKPKARRGFKGAIDDFREFKVAISQDAVEFGADERTEFAAWVMVAGIWTRIPSKIQEMIGCRSSISRIGAIGRRFVSSGIWQKGNTVVLGEMDGSWQEALEFWMNAMVGTGQIDGRYTEHGMFYRQHRDGRQPWGPLRPPDAPSGTGGKDA